MSDIENVSLVYKEIYLEEEVRIYYLSKEDGFIFRYGTQDEPDTTDYHARVSRKEAIQDAREYLDNLYNFAVPQNEEKWLDLFSEMYYSDFDGSSGIDDKKAFIVALDKYVEWRNANKK